MMATTPVVDVENRDPNSLNEYLQQLRDDLQMVDAPQPKRIQLATPVAVSYLTVEFDDVIAEPEGTYSPHCVWRNARYIFTCSKNCCYKFLAIVCALPISFAVGCSFACLSFQHIWCIGPALRHWTINCHVVRQFMRAALDSCLGPCCATLGLVCSRIRVSHHSERTGV